MYASCKNTNKCTDPTTSGDFTSGNFTELPSRVINKRDDGLTQQEPLPAKDEMVFISQASSAPLNSLGGKYVYDKSAGKDAIVYVVDTGAFLDNKVSLVPFAKVLLLSNTQTYRISQMVPMSRPRLLGYTRGPILPAGRKISTRVTALVC